VTAPEALPRGFRAAGVAAGIKSSGSPDLALVVNDGPTHHVAAVFTSNRVQAAPVIWSRQVVADGVAEAVILNSGGANACTGPRGFQDTHHTAEKVAAVLGIGPGDVVVCSTGLIGERLPMAALLPGVDAVAAALSTDGLAAAARAIMTTDTVPKMSSAAATGWSVAGIAKGAGMLAPALATMLVVVTTDAVVSQPTLATALLRATEVTFDRIDSDGCQSTNDTVVAMASGASGVEVSLDDLTAALRTVCADLARQLIADAEGAHHEVQIDVRGAASIDDAVEVGRAVARNNLVKCAIFGGDPNWGRILAAIGTTAATFEPDDIDVAINGVPVCRGGATGEDRTKVDLTARVVRILIDLHAGVDSATILTNDLTHDYVHENSAYSS
jgi:glutamate N-acetyltransferase/amino-acid N-acetyltransferase